MNHALDALARRNAGVRGARLRGLRNGFLEPARQAVRDGRRVRRHGKNFCAATPLNATQSS